MGSATKPCEPGAKALISRTGPGGGAHGAAQWVKVESSDFRAAWCSRRGHISVNSVSDASAPGSALTGLGGIWENKSAAFPLKNEGLQGINCIAISPLRPLESIALPLRPVESELSSSSSAPFRAQGIWDDAFPSDREGHDRSGLRFRDSGSVHICQLCVLGHSHLASLGLSFPLCKTKGLGSKAHAAPMQDFSHHSHSDCIRSLGWV